MNLSQSLKTMAALLLAALTLCAIVLWSMYDTWPKPKINVPQLINGRVLVVTIDSAATDSVFGKIWRYK
jgi:hypothetical protein